MSTLERVKIIVAKQLDIDPSALKETADLQEAGFESLDVIEVIFNLEDEFKINIPFNANESDANEMKTIGDIVRMVENILAGAGPAEGQPADGAAK